VSGAALTLLPLLAGCGGPVEIARPPRADRAACQTLADSLPTTVGDLRPAAFTPQDAEGGAWGDPPITLTCGVGVPAGFGPASSCIAANGVDWFAPDEQSQDNRADITLTTVTLKPRVALHVPATYRGATLAAVLVDLSGPLKSALTVGARCL
jgi:hypothetical protein